MAVEGVLDVGACSNVDDDLATSPQVSTGRGSMVLTAGAGRGLVVVGARRLGLRAAEGRVLLLGRTPAGCGVDGVEYWETPGMVGLGNTVGWFEGRRWIGLCV